jgi:hypothetical protein
MMDLNAQTGALSRFYFFAGREWEDDGKGGS